MNMTSLPKAWKKQRLTDCKEHLDTSSFSISTIDAQIIDPIAVSLEFVIISIYILIWGFALLPLRGEWTLLLSNGLLLFGRSFGTQVNIFVIWNNTKVTWCRRNYRMLHAVSALDDSDLIRKRSCFSNLILLGTCYIHGFGYALCQHASKNPYNPNFPDELISDFLPCLRREYEDILLIWLVTWLSGEQQNHPVSRWRTVRKGIIRFVSMQLRTWLKANQVHQKRQRWK